MPTPQSQAIGIANEIIEAAIALDTLYDSIVSISQRWTDDAVANELNALATTALNTDGSPGAADGTPNPAHPINLTNYPAFTRMLSANQIASMLTCIQGVKTYVEGGAISATPGVRAILNSSKGA